MKRREEENATTLTWRYFTFMASNESDVPLYKDCGEPTTTWNLEVSNQPSTEAGLAPVTDDLLPNSPLILETLEELVTYFSKVPTEESILCDGEKPKIISIHKVRKNKQAKVNLDLENPTGLLLKFPSQFGMKGSPKIKFEDQNYSLFPNKVEIHVALSVNLLGMPIEKPEDVIKIHCPPSSASTSEIFFPPNTAIELIMNWLKSPSEAHNGSLKPKDPTNNVEKGKNVFILCMDLNRQSKIECHVQFRQSNPKKKENEPTDTLIEQYKDTLVTTKRWRDH